MKTKKRFQYPSWILVTAILIASIAVLSFAYYWVSEFTILFSLHQLILNYFSNPASQCLLLFFAVALAFIELKPNVSAVHQIIVWIILGISLCSICSGTILTVFKSYQYNDSLNTQNSSYHVDSWWAVGVGGASDIVYRVWSCDRANLICRKIFWHNTREINNLGDFKNISASLIINPETNYIEFHIGDQLLYSWLE